MEVYESMVKVLSNEILDKVLVDNLINSTNTYMNDVQTNVGAQYPITELRINFKENRVFAVWDDYSDEEQRSTQLIEEYSSLKVQLTDPLAQPTLFKQLIDIANEFKQLTGMNIEEVVG